LNLLSVTGASGFVGRAVCERALELGLKVRGSHRSLFSQPLVPAGVEKIQIASVDRNTDWSGALVGADVVIHLAGRVHAAEIAGRDSLAIYREINTAGTERLARMAVTAGVRRLVYVSSIKVNGEQSSRGSFTATDAPFPEGAYAISKWESEQALHRVGAESALEIVILRPPLVYGRGVGANFSRLLHLVQRGIPLPFASVSNRRSFIYVKNLADAIITSAAHPRAMGQTFLVSDGEDISTPELIRRIADVMGVPPRMFRCPPSLLNAAASIVGRSAEVSRLLASLALDSTKFRSEIGWIPRYTMSQGLGETIAWYLDNKALTGKNPSASGKFAPRLGRSAKQ
jgi:nucleoside-diphosphate-sugar epimerase